MPDEQTIETTQGAPAPAETAAPQGEAAPAATASPDGQSPADSSTGTEGEQQEGQEASDDKPRDERGRFKGVQGRIDELTRAKHQAEREAAYWRSLAAAPATQQGGEAAPKPTQEQFTDYAQYVEALTEWKAEQKAREIFAARDAEQAKRADAQARQARAETFSERAGIVRTQLPDFDKVVGSAEVVIAPHVSDAILESDVGPQLAYHLAKNPDVAERLSAMSPIQAARELGRLEASLARPTTPQPAAAKPATNAPAPMRPIGSGAPPPGDPSRMTNEQYRAFRKAQGARWAN